MSVALGVKDVRPARHGIGVRCVRQPREAGGTHAVLDVTDASGHVILDNSKAADNAKPVIADVIADNVTDVLRGVLVSGTGGREGTG